MGLTIIKPNTNFDFIGFRKFAFALSGLLILIGIVSLLIKGGPRYGIDFAGGMVVQIKFDQDIKVRSLKDALKNTGLPNLVIQRFGSDTDHEYLLRLPLLKQSGEQVRKLISEALNKNLKNNKFEIQRLEMVGPKVGKDLKNKALEALFYAVLLIAIYISGRFEHKWALSALMAAALGFGVYILKLVSLPTSFLIVGAMLITLFLCWYLKLKYALGAVVALIHDVTITVGIFSLLNKEFDLTIVAALLTIIGYSLNDTIIVFDRIRENLRGKKIGTFAQVINKSINQTLSRTILTSGTTLMVVLCLLIFGGGVIHDFALALFIGILVGTYSSIYVASPILLSFGDTRAKDKE
ncbi:preprotein translocase subunit SecF [Desulfonauticus submarinus]|uniref:Protein-export membrane protein SecF n=1 Tax=Desulfonauticus submarinus TaxID=206665 RepID=A0A1H0CNX1_9BACT|nr:protein translocase subunit SecF [Desulfonauticus submarinus]SDN59579.1 preprotein translocase subunit SecF [Desulfonauticus submarinus]